MTVLERDGGCAVRIADDGCGFDPALAAPDSPSEGFAAMRARAELGCGSLHVESAPGCGTTVEAWLPHLPASDAGMSASPIRVLIAEEDDVARDELATLVRSEPSLELADAVSDAAEAILVSMREKPAVAVLDVRIPGGGASAARGIKRCSPQTRILALSVQDDRETVLEMLEAGADGYLVKGSSADIIVTSIERASRGQGSLSVEVTGGVIEELAGLLHARRRSEERSQRREERIRRVLDDDLLHTVYQPICTLAGSTVGAEALARFRGPPSRGPLRWFAEADEVGLLRELELAAVRVALTALPDLPEHVFLSINVSPGTLATRGVPAADRGQRRCARRRRDHRARAHQRLRAAWGRRSTPCVRSACASRSTTPARASRACATSCGSSRSSSSSIAR